METKAKISQRLWRHPAPSDSYLYVNLDLSAATLSGVSEFSACWSQLQGRQKFPHCATFNSNTDNVLTHLLRISRLTSPFFQCANVFAFSSTGARSR